MSAHPTPDEFSQFIHDYFNQQSLLLQQHLQQHMTEQLKEAIAHLHTVNAEMFENLSKKLIEKIEQKINLVFASHVNKFKLQLKQLALDP